MNKELKSLLILSLFTVELGACAALADGPSVGRSQGQGGQAAAPQAAAMGEYAGPERTQAAMGHYARARTLLVEAMREFDAGKDIARPDLILNSETWKAGVSARADELGHIISPQGRETAGGARFKENKSLLNEKFDAPKKVASAPAARSVKKSKREQVLVSVEKKEENFARARMNEKSEPESIEIKETKTTIIKEPEVPVLPKEEVEAPSGKVSNDERDLNELLANEKPAKVEADPELEKAVDSELSRTMGDKMAEEKPSSDDGRTAGPPAEESETAKSINDDEIRARLKKLSEEIAQEEKNKR